MTTDHFYTARKSDLDVRNTVRIHVLDAPSVPGWTPLRLVDAYRQRVTDGIREALPDTMDVQINEAGTEIRVTCYGSACATMPEGLQRRAIAGAVAGAAVWEATYV